MKAAGSRWQTGAVLANPWTCRVCRTSLVKRLSAQRSYATEASVAVDEKGRVHQKKSSQVRARFNEIGVQHLSSQLHPQIFPGPEQHPPPELLELSKDHLSRHDLLGRNQEQPPPLEIDLPPLLGSSLDEHFYRLGKSASEPFYTKALKFSYANLPPIRGNWQVRSGWTKYNTDGTWKAVDSPEEDMLTFDVEVMWKESQYAVMATAASPTAWYAWLSPWLLGETENDKQLIPLGDPTKERVVIGHNIGYDRARIAEEYNLRQSRNFFLDTMSLHVAVNGMCSRQRPTWMKHMKNRDMRDKIASEANSHELEALLQNNMLSEEEEELWVGRSSINSLRDVAKFHLDVKMDKSQRDFFGELDREALLEKVDELLNYCAADVAITHRVYTKVFPTFLRTCPHPVSFGALRHLSSVILPVDKTWEAYIQNAEATCQRLTVAVEDRLHFLAKSALEIKAEPEKYLNDPWMRQLDWSGQEIKMVKGKKKNDPPRPAARQKLPGMPKWWKDLFASAQSDMNLTVRTRIAPLLLRLAWDGYPLVWTDKHGWTYKVPKTESGKYAGQAATPCDVSEEDDPLLRDDWKHNYFKLPHKDGPTARCANPLAKGYLQYFNSGKLTSEYELAKEALEMNASCSYWVSARDRICTQMAVYEKEAVGVKETGSGTQQGFILPQVVPMGTITRRAVENTWLTASNAKENRVGSELKSMVKAPPGYHFVGADVDSEELWIASLVGDAQFQLHGGNAIGFMTLEGTKAAGTDLHSKTAKTLGISRNDAKVFNYGRIYGAGMKFATSLLRQFNPALPEEQAQATASRLYRETKGTKTSRKALSKSSFWRGGTESFLFNTLEAFADQERPRTPVLGAGITEALRQKYISKGGFLTSRINWAIQSSGVDYLHLLIVSMDYLIARFQLDARLAITVHDEIRYLVRSEDRYRVAMALQVANIWTRAMFSQQVGIDELPQSCAFFSAVDVDHVLRKEVDMDCITPSHPDRIAHGESLDIWQLKDKGAAAALDANSLSKGGEEVAAHHRFPDPAQWQYTEREPVMQDLRRQDPVTLAKLRAQITADDGELKEIVKEVTKAARPDAPPRPRKSNRKSSDDGSSGSGSGSSAGSSQRTSFSSLSSSSPSSSSPSSSHYYSSLPAGRRYKAAPPQELNLPDSYAFMNFMGSAGSVRPWQQQQPPRSYHDSKHHQPAGRPKHHSWNI